VHFASLAALREPELVAETIANALEATTSDAFPALSAIENVIREKPTLLLLDNFERVISGGGTVSELLSDCPGLKVIVTSRSPLRIRGEHEVEVLPLALPPSDLRREDIGNCPAIQLFVESAKAVRPNFEVDEKSAGVIAEICRQLDGLPLAIELAAATTRVLTPEMLLERLRDRFADLRTGSRDMPERHQRLNDTIAWSYDLLDDETKEAFAQLGVFRGGFTLDAAEKVCESDADVFALVSSLTEQSLVRADVRSGDVARFSMLSTIRHFAWLRLEESSHKELVVDNHARFFVSMTEGMSRPEGRSPEALDKVEIELDNIRRAFEWLLEQGDPDPVASAMSESWWLWWWRGYLREGRLWADRCLAAPGLGREARAKALSARAIFAIWSREYELAVPMFIEASEVARETGDTRSLAYADIGLGLVRALTTSMQEGVALIRRGTAALEDMDDAVGATTGLAAITWVQGITRQFDDTDETFLLTLERARTIGSDGDMGIAESALAQYRMARGESDGVYDLIGSSLEHLARARHVGSTILTLEVVAELIMPVDPTRAVCILAATAAIRSDMGTEVPPRAADRLEQLLEEGLERLGDRFDESSDRGSRLGFAEAIDQGREALAALQADTPPTALVSHPNQAQT
jgi:predicted ATPase